MTIEDDSLNGTIEVIKDKHENIEKSSNEYSDRIRKFLSDGKWRSVRAMITGIGLKSAGHLDRTLKRMVYIKEIETGTCEHCDSTVTLYRLK